MKKIAYSVSNFQKVKGIQDPSKVGSINPGQRVVVNIITNGAAPCGSH